MSTSGPQCAGLLGDFVYLSPDVVLTVPQLQEKMLWHFGKICCQSTYQISAQEQYAVGNAFVFRPLKGHGMRYMDQPRTLQRTELEKLLECKAKG